MKTGILGSFISPQIHPPLTVVLGGMQLWQEPDLPAEQVLPDPLGHPGSLWPAYSWKGQW